MGQRQESRTPPRNHCSLRFLGAEPKGSLEGTENGGTSSTRIRREPPECSRPGTQRNGAADARGYEPKRRRA